MIVVVTGPPCGGKSTYVRLNRQPGDYVIDMDDLAMAIQVGAESHDYDETTRAVARAARNAAVGELLKRMQGERRKSAFIIHTDPPPEMRMSYRAFGARFVEMNPGKDECLRRAAERPDVNQRLVRQVLDDYYSKRL